MRSRVNEAEVGRRIEQFTAACKKAGVKLTPQRLEIYREVAGSVEHPSAEVVLKAVQPRMPTVSLDTVYRTLWLLSDLGLVTTLGPRRESVRFDANLAQHHHYVCVRCGQTCDFESPSLNALRLPPRVKELGTVLGTRVEVRGVCDGCTKRAEESEDRNPRQVRGKKRSKV
jgi:Fur family transcriptional regulator, peroxide stress response regulator